LKIELYYKKIALIVSCHVFGEDLNIKVRKHNVIKGVEEKILAGRSGPLPLAAFFKLQGA
jgi:hypothetical protein